MPSRRQSDLSRQARKFSGEIAETLNRTITDGLSLSVVMDASGRAAIGNRINEREPVGSPVALTVTKAPASLELRFLHSLELDESRKFLTTSKSTYKLCAAGSGEPIVTYDYTREPPNEYPEAHLHIHGYANNVQLMLERCGRPKDKPDDLHFPVGGRRFRPCLEDLIEFCVLERLVEPRPGWQEALNESRRRFRDDQLRAAVRRSPEIAAEVLNQEGWRVTGSDED